MCRRENGSDCPARDERTFRLFPEGAQQVVNEWRVWPFTPRKDNCDSPFRLLRTPPYFSAASASASPKFCRRAMHPCKGSCLLDSESRLKACRGRHLLDSEQKLFGMTEGVHFGMTNGRFGMTRLMKLFGVMFVYWLGFRPNF